MKVVTFYLNASLYDVNYMYVDYTCPLHLCVGWGVGGNIVREGYVFIYVRLFVFLSVC